MTTTEVIKALRLSDIVVDDVVIGTKKTNKTVPISFRDKPLVFQTPFLEVKGTLRKTAYPNIYQLDTLFKGDTKQRIHQWYQFIENLETHISNQVVKNGSNWFTQADVNIKSLIRELDLTKEIFFVKWPVDLKTNIFIDEKKKSFNPVDLKDKDCIKLIVEISDLWISDNNCGLAVIVQRILVKPYMEKIQTDYVFDDDDVDSESDIDDNENNIISLLATEQKTRPKETLSQQNNLQPQNNNNNNTKTPFVQQPNLQTKFNPPMGGVFGGDIFANDIQFNKFDQPYKKEQQDTIQKKNKIASEAKEIVLNKNAIQEQNMKKKTTRLQIY